MKIVSLILLMFFSLIGCSQNLIMITFTVSDNITHNPIIYKEAVLFHNSTIIDAPFIDDKGSFTFIIENLSFNTDSVYFYIKTDDTLSSNTKIFINKLNLLKNNNIINYNIRITDFRYFTTEEYIKYFKENGLIPKRRETPAKDVH